MRGALSLLLLSACCISGAAQAADLPVKAVAKSIPAPSWTGFYVGAQVGGGWADRTVNYANNDPASSNLVNGAAGLTGEQPFASHGVNLSGVTGGIEAGYNWQIGANWLVGLEADFSGSGIKGNGNGTSVLQSTPTPYTQTVTSEQKVEWWGTVRGRLGWLATHDLLLFGTGGFAYGRISGSDSYIFNGPPPAVIGGGLGGFAFACTVNTTCFSGSDSQLRTGWTAGAGGEWRFASNWTLKAEYLYVDLGNASVNSTALAVPAGNTPSSYSANFGRTDFHIARLGVNYQF